MKRLIIFLLLSAANSHHAQPVRSHRLPGSTTSFVQSSLDPMMPGGMMVCCPGTSCWTLQRSS